MVHSKIVTMAVKDGRPTYESFRNSHRNVACVAGARRGGGRGEGGGRKGKGKGAPALRAYVFA